MATRKKECTLPCSTRVNDKIVEYYMKFGKERDLQKFMRLHSPAHSRSQTTTTASSSCSDDGALCCLFNQESDHKCEERPLHPSKSLPNIETEGKTEAPKEFVIPIRIEGQENAEEDRAKANNAVDAAANSSDDLLTPAKSKLQSRQTQTPDSIAKSHKRLEWDSLGDVGYIKAMSTSNISILERSLLREFFQESSSSATTTTNIRPTTNVSENDLNELQKELLKERKFSASKHSNQNTSNNTPPLASSTFVDVKGGRQTKPNYASKATSTSTSLQKKFEKYAQTSIQRSAFASEGVQVDISSVEPSNIGSSATPSSFEYYSSHSSQSTGAGPTKYRDEYKLSDRQRTVHPFIDGITEMLSRRKALTEKHNNLQSISQADELKQLHETLQQALDENKENSKTHSSYGTLDLGIQLLCSLIDAKSLNHKEKKKLVRDIVKRISQMGSEYGAISTSVSGSNVTTERSTSASTSSHTADSEAAELRKTKKHISSSLGMQENANNLPAAKINQDVKSALKNYEKIGSTGSSSGAEGEQIENVTVFKRPSPPTTSANALAKLAALNAAANVNTNKYRNSATNTQTQTVNNVPKVATSKVQNEPDKIDMELQIDTPKTMTNATAPSTAKTSKLITITTIRSSTSTISKTPSPSSSSSKDLTTQKMAVVHNNSNSTDADEAAMREWLNPMTQSEIEYEEKKRERREKSVQSNIERKVQLNWIETEIQRLESLRHLLLQENSNTTSPSEVMGDKLRKTASTERSTSVVEKTEKLYDTVCTDKISSSSSSSVRGKSAERSEQEIQVIIEESHEDLIDLEKKLKRTKERKRETEIIYDKPNDTGDHNDQKQNNALFRKVKETITTNEEQVLKPGKNQGGSVPAAVQKSKSKPVQRSKIDTPSTGSNESESVCNYVQQRKREFMQHYNNKRKTHYEALLHHQQQDDLQHRQQYAQHQPTSGHYSVPHTMHRSQPRPHHHIYYYPHQCHHHQHQHPLPATIPPTAPPPPPPPPPAPPVVTTQIFSKSKTLLSYSESAGLTSQPEISTGPQQHSSSSMFCVSSEVSIPMGSNATSSSPTTTHQYDDVAGGGAGAVGIGVGVQTSESVLRSHPIFGPRSCHFSSDTQCWQQPQAVSSSQSAVCIQVKPKAIAYVIQFDKKASSDEAIILTGSTTTTTTTTTATETTTVTSDGQQQKQEGNQPELTLQEYLQRAKPQFCEHSKERKAILNQLQALRQERERKMREIIENTSTNSLDRKLQNLPPPATKQLRIFPTKEMKAITNKRCSKLPEVLERQQRDLEERRRHGNRLLRDIFNHRLQKRVRSGKLSLNHSKTVI